MGSKKKFSKGQLVPTLHINDAYLLMAKLHGSEEVKVKSITVKIAEHASNYREEEIPGARFGTKPARIREAKIGTMRQRFPFSPIASPSVVREWLKEINEWWVRKGFPRSSGLAINQVTPMMTERIVFSNRDDTVSLVLQCLKSKRSSRRKGGYILVPSVPFAGE